MLINPRLYLQVGSPKGPKLLTYSGVVPLIYINKTICWYFALLNRFMARDELSGAILNFMTFLSLHYQTVSDYITYS